MTRSRPSNGSYQITQMLAATNYRSHGLYLHAVGDPNNPQIVHQSDNSTITGVMTLTPNGQYCDVKTAGGLTARFLANRLEWFDSAGVASPSSNTTDPDYYGTPVTAS
ncbi:hypothetical protein H4696_008458 [Amycolatopsis lexingtonensis]|uniref:Uncharacterized protein n=1 Tax=Amycolatopsis lexingtonensis TaxID=218822 RepID=A0ABR9IDU6_9PSEU|nr:hypothetical protein [Amycolatopsis lexingtonensis]MBE1501358.1 hypothetical protein [Amycolatopsis lexingtonensis]